MLRKFPMARKDNDLTSRSNTESHKKSVLAIRGARTHNLRSIDLDIPHRAITVITGVSGSGKSSLAFDTLFAEGQRQYIDSLSPYSRQFVDSMPREFRERTAKYQVAGVRPLTVAEREVMSGTPTLWESEVLLVP